MKILKSRFVQSVIALMTGNLIALLFSIGSSPVTARLFTPQNFGTLALFVSIVAIAGGISSLCYERAIVLPKSDEDAIAVKGLSFIILIVITSISLLLIIFFKDVIVELLHNEEFIIWLWFIPFAIFIRGAIRILRFWRIRNKEFKSIAAATVCETVCSASVKITAGFFIGAVTGGLIFGFVFGIFIAGINLLLRPKIINFKRIIDVVSLRRISRLAKTYKKFPYFASWNFFLNLLSQEIAVFILAFFYTPAIVGFYSLGNRVLGQSIMILSESIHNSYFQKASEYVQNKISVLNSLKKISVTLLLLGFVPFIILSVWGKLIFVVIFGSNWEMAGAFVQIMSPWFLFILLSAPANVVFEVFQKQDIKLVLNICRTIFRVASLCVGYYFFGNPTKVLLFFSCTNVVFESVNIVLAFCIIKREDHKLVK